VHKCRKYLAKVIGKNSVTAVSISLLFIISSVSLPVVMASGNSQQPLATKPLSTLEANWTASTGNQFNQDYNPQNVINSSNAQYLGLSWLFPLPTHPTALTSVGAGLGVDSAPMIINGTIYFVTQFDQVFALNAANGNVLWTDVLPLQPNSTAGHGTGPLSLHLHDGNVQFTTKLFGNTPTFWVAADDQKMYAINALNGKYELNFSVFNGVATVKGTNPTGQYTGVGAANLLVDEKRGILISSVVSASSANTGRCFFRGWNILVNPPTQTWETYCTPPQPGSAIGTDPNWDISQVNSMQHAWIFKGYGRDVPGGYGGPNGAVDLKALSATQLNTTLYDDWGYVNQTPACRAYTGGGSTGGTAAGWGAPWLLGAGPTDGLAFVNTNNRDPYTSPCMPGPDLWSAAILALNDTSGKWVWGFQASAHEMWDWDCSWWQAMGNETISGVNTQVIWKTCKDGYLYELNAQTGALVWSWTPPTNYLGRCHYCYLVDPLNKTEMSWAYFNPTAMGAGQGTLMYPSEAAEFEDESSYSPASNYIYLIAQNLPGLAYYVAPNSTNYKTNSGIAFVAPGGGPLLGAGPTPGNNATVFAVNAATGQIVWTHFIPTQGYRGGNTVSGNVIFITLSSGDLLMLNAQTGATIKDFYIGGPLNVLPSVGATASGQMQVVLPITAGLVTWGTGVPGDIVALNLQNLPSTSVNTVTSTAAGPTVTTTVGGSSGTVTVTSTVGGGSGTVTVTSTAPGTATGTGVDTTTLYGVAAVAVIFIIATGYLAMRGRKPAA
jgi:glucose dehydrogenase